MREKDRLSALQMGVTGHDNIDMLLGDLERRSLQRAKMRIDFGDLRLDVKPEIDRDLIVAAAGGVELRAGGPNSFRKRSLDIHVHIFKRLVPPEFASFNFLFDRAQSVVDL